MPFRNWIERRRHRSNSSESQDPSQNDILSSRVTDGSNLTTKQAFPSYCIVGTVYAIWGFSLGLSDTLNTKFEQSYDISSLTSSFLQTALYIPFCFAPLTLGARLTERLGYRRAIAVGLVIFGAGSIVHFASALTEAIIGFFIAYFICGIGISCLESSCSPFVAGCGPSRWSELRLTAAMGISSLAQVGAILLSGQFFFVDEYQEHKHKVDPVTAIFGGLTCFVFLMALIVYISRMPEISEEDPVLQEGAVEKPLLRQRGFLLASLSLVFYFAAQIAISVFFIDWLTETAELFPADAANFLALANLVFALGRLVFAVLMRFLNPARLLLFSATSATGLFGTAIFISMPKAALILMIIFFFAKAAIGPAIYALALRDLGSNTKRGGGVLTSAHCGGAFAPIFGRVADRQSFSAAFRVPFVGLALSTMMFPLAVNTIYWKKYGPVKEGPEVDKDIAKEKNDNHDQRQMTSPEMLAATSERAPPV